MRSDWQPVKFLIEVIALQMVVIGMAITLVLAVF
jgi:hypothetical protein